MRAGPLFRTLGALTVWGSVLALAGAQESPHKPESARLGYEDVHTLAARLLKYADAADCQKDDCKLLVTNLVLASGHGSFYGRQLADSLSHEIQTQEPAVQVIDRSLLYSYLESERIPSENSSDNVLRAIGFDLKATTVVVGTTKRLDDDTVELAARLLSVNEKEHIGNTAKVDLFAPLTVVDLSPSEAYPSLPPITQTSTGEPVYHAGMPIHPAGTEGTNLLPLCSYTPNPPYTQATRALRINGSLMIEAIVTAEGRVEDPRIVRGLPGGLNEDAIQTLKTWRCKPAQKDGKPVAVVVPFEINFRLY